MIRLQPRFPSLINVLMMTCTLAGAAAARGGPFAPEGTAVVVTTDRYRVVGDDLSITHVKNKLTGEVYAVSPPAPTHACP